jgi:hypothetical protein
MSSKRTVGSGFASFDVMPCRPGATNISGARICLDVGRPIFGSRDAREAMCAFSEKRKPVNTGK